MTEPRFKMNAIITKSGRVLAVGENKCHAGVISGVQKYSKELWLINRHAERAVIEKVLKQYDGIKHLAGATIYVTRHGKTGETRLAKPCKYCMELIESVGIKKVVYTTTEGAVELKL